VVTKPKDLYIGHTIACDKMPETIITEEGNDGESKTAFKFLRQYGASAKQPYVDGWSNVVIAGEILPYDDTDGTGFHPNEPGLQATMRITSPSGKTYVSCVTFDEDAHREERDGYYSILEEYMNQSSRISPNPDEQPVYLKT
jgi:hypothetical protein